MRRFSRNRTAAYVICAVALTAMVWAIAVWTVLGEREQRFAESAEDARRLAVFFERHALSAFRYGDSYLRMVRREYLQARDLAAVRKLMKDVPLDRSIVSHITIIDEAGTPLLVSGHEIKPGTTAVDRDYFQFQKGHEGDRVFVSLPHRGRNTGKLIVRLVRRMSTPDDGFRGVVFAALETASITEFMGAMHLGPNSSATLVGTDKKIRARSSYGRLGPGQDISGSRIWRELERSPVGLYEQTSVVDGITRYYAYRLLSEFPLIVAIGVSTEDIRQTVSQFQTPAFVIAVLATILIVTVTVLLFREILTSQKLASSESRVRTVVETVNDGIVTIDESGTIQSCNSSVGEIFGYEVKELLGRHISVLSGELSRDEHDRCISDYLATGKAKILGQGYREVRARRKDGSVFPAELSIGEIRGNEGSLFVGTIRDITSRVEAENTIREMHDQLERRVEERTAELAAVQDELLRKERLAVLGQLTGTVAHELRNPLGTISTTAAVMERKAKSAGVELGPTVARVRRNVERCNKIITELLDFARAKGLDRQPTTLDRWLSEILSEFHYPNDVAFECELDASETVVALDRDRIRRAIINVVENARDAVIDASRSNGAGRVVVSSRVARDRVEIEVSDNGAGMSEELMSKIYEPLFSTKTFGVGLGLPVVKQVMEEHGGGFEMASQEGRGTRAVLWLPLPMAHASAMRA